MGLFNFFKKNNRQTNEPIKESIDYVKYFYKPMTLFADGNFLKAVAFCDENYEILSSFVKQEKAFAFLLLMYSNDVGYRKVPSKRFSVDEAKAKKEDNRAILSAYCSDQSPNHSGFWYTTYCVMNGQSMTKDKKIEYLKKGASLGNALAYYDLAMIYHPNQRQGRFSKEEDDLYVYYLNETLKLYPNHSSALNDLGTAYFDGRSVEKDKEKAVELFEKAAENDSLFAMYNLGTYYADIKTTKAIFYLCKYTKDSFDADGVKEAFKICVRLSRLDNPFDLMRCYLYLRTLLSYPRFSDVGMIHHLIVDYLPRKPKLFRLIETMVYHADEMDRFDVCGIVNNEIVAWTRHNSYETADLLADYFLNYLLSENKDENDKLVDLFDKMFAPIPVEKLQEFVDLYDKAIYSIGISRVAETAVMDYQFDKPE